VTACLDCHDLKDRYALLTWPTEAWQTAIKGLFIEGQTSVPLDGSVVEQLDWIIDQPSVTDDAILARWNELPPVSRLMYAKVRAKEEERRHRQRRDGLPVSFTPTFGAIFARNRAKHR
jgi:hypothetical protein